VLQRGAAKGGVEMPEQSFQNMIAYQAAMGLARSMLHQGIISEEEYDKIDTIMTKKYGLPLDSIFRNNA
jgi:hypothetical protein